jgi:hypothetical protein
MYCLTVKVQIRDFKLACNMAQFEFIRRSVPNGDGFLGTDTGVIGSFQSTFAVVFADYCKIT